MADIKNIAFGSTIPDKRLIVHNNELIEIKRSYKIHNNQAVIIWDIATTEDVLIIKFSIKSNEFTFPALESTSHTGTIDWGDSTTEEYDSALSYTHTYAQVGIYELKINCEIIKFRDFCMESDEIKEVILPSTVKSIGHCTFQNSTLESIVINEGLEEISSSAFQSSKLQNIVIPDTVHTIGDYAFQYCAELQECKITENIEYKIITGNTFGYCTSLKRIIMGKNISEIKVFAFNNCSALTDIEYNGTIQEWNSITKITINSMVAWNAGCPEITVHCSNGSIVIPKN